MVAQVCEWKRKYNREMTAGKLRMEKSTTVFSKYWSPSMMADEYLRFSRKLTANLISSPLSSIPQIQAAYTTKQIQTILRSYKTTVGLIFPVDGIEPQGWIYWDGRLTMDPERGEIPADAVLEPETSIREGMELVSRTGAALVKEKDGRTIGIIFPGDFNKPAARSFLYQWLITLEIGVDILIEKRMMEKDWRPFLSDIALEEMERIYENEGRRNPNIRKIDCLSFRSRLTIVAKGGLLEGLSMKMAMHLSNLRNAIMHPVIPIVSSRSELAALTENYTQIKQLVSLAGDYSG
jgi:hypothetical protein